MKWGASPKCYFPKYLKTSVTRSTVFRRISKSDGERVGRGREIEYGLHKSIHAVIRPARFDRAVKVSMGKIRSIKSPSGFGNPDLGGKPNLQSVDQWRLGLDELSAAANGLVRTPVRCVTQYV